MSAGPQTGTTPTVPTVLGVLVRAWRILVVGTILGAVVGFGVASLRATRYEATAYLIGGRVGPDPIDASLVAGLLKVYAKVTTDPAVVGPAIRDSGLSIDPQHLRERVSATASPDSPLLSVTANAATPGEAAKVANTVAATIATYSSKFAPTTGYQLSSFTQASPPSSPSGPGKALFGGLGAALALVVAIFVAIVRAEQRRTTIARVGEGSPASDDAGTETEASRSTATNPSVWGRFMTSRSAATADGRSKKDVQTGRRGDL